jgi:hypothetical protein
MVLKSPLSTSTGKLIPENIKQRGLPRKLSELIAEIENGKIKFIGGI